MRIGVLGLGTITSALVEGIGNDGHTIIVSERNAINSARLSEKFRSVSVAKNQSVVDTSDVIFLGLTDGVYKDALSGLTFREGQKIVSLMAGPQIAEVAPLVAPAQLVARMIPFPSISTGGSQILVFGQTELIEELFGARNTIFPIDSEDALADWLCVQAVLSPAVLMVQQAAEWLADQGADAESSERFVRELVGSSLLAGPCAPLLRALDTPGGYNQRLRDMMVDGGMTVHLKEGLKALQE